MARWVSGVDVSFDAIDLAWAQRRRAEGFRIFVQCGWTGGYANNRMLRDVAGPNLGFARQGDLTPSLYINANPWYAADVSLREAKLNAGGEWDYVSVVAVDWEIAGTTVDQCIALCEAVEAEGKKVCIYTAAWFLNSIGNPQDERLRRWKAWLADYDGEANIATTKLTGPWELGDLIGKQYQGTTTVE